MNFLLNNDIQINFSGRKSTCVSISIRLHLRSKLQRQCTLVVKMRYCSFVKYQEQLILEGIPTLFRGFCFPEYHHVAVNKTLNLSRKHVHMPKWLSRYQIGIGYKCRNQQEIEGLSELLERERTCYMSLPPESGNSLLLSWHCDYFEAAVQMIINHICKRFNTVLASNTIVIIKMKWIFLS